MASRTALITGGGGFIGRRLARGLAEAGYRVRVLDLAGGSGDLTRLLARDVGPGGEVVILDFERLREAGKVSR